MNKKMQILGVVVMTAVVFSVTVLTGCKKDEEGGGGGSTSITQIKMKKSAETVNIGTTVTLEYETTPAGIAPQVEKWSSADTNIASVSDKGVVTGIAAGSVYVRVKVNNQFVDSCKVTVVSSITDLSSNGTANCYIVSRAGEYKFKMVKGNCTDSIISPTGYSVLWESFGTDSVPKVGALVKNVILGEDYVYFIASAEKGNAVIAVMDGTNVLWSWHIWFTDAPAGQIYNNSAGTMMDRNLGATSVDKGQVGALGLFYQWGRKDPFPGPSSVSSSAWSSSTGSWNYKSVEKTIPAGDSTALVYSTQNPTTFIYPEKNPFDWYCADSKYQDSTLWNKNAAKTIYDPCPVGWRVPAGGESGIWSKAFDSPSPFIGPWDSYGLGMDFGNSSSHSLGNDASIWYPAVGYLDYAVFLNAVGSTGYYWSCTTPGSLHADVFHFGSGSLVNLLESKYRAFGFSVRCVKE